VQDTIPIPFTFPVENDEGEHIFERTAFWDSPLTLEWFRHRGYALYAHNNVDEYQPCYSEPTLKCQPSCQMQYPYSHYDSEGNTGTPLRASEFIVGSPSCTFLRSFNLSSGESCVCAGNARFVASCCYQTYRDWFGRTPHPQIPTVAGVGSLERKLSRSNSQHPLERAFLLRGHAEASEHLIIQLSMF
jgi:hypothetical protein